MDRYLLDTNAISSAVRQPAGPVGQRLLLLPRNAVLTSPVVLCEVRYGLVKRASPALTERVEQMLATLEVLPFGNSFPATYAELRMALEQLGKPIGAMDLLIAAHALSEEATLVTANWREFSRVPGLRVENWEASAG